MRIHGTITVRSIDYAIIASTDVDGRKTRIATYTFCKNKTQTDSEHKE